MSVTAVVRSYRCNQQYVTIGSGNCVTYDRQQAPKAILTKYKHTNKQTKSNVDQDL